MQRARLIRIRVYLVSLTPVLAGLTGLLVFGLLCRAAGVYRNVDPQEVEFLKSLPANFAAQAHDAAAAFRWAIAATLLVLGFLAVTVVCFGAWISRQSNQVRARPAVLGSVLLFVLIAAYSVAKARGFEFGGPALHVLLIALWKRTGSNLDFVTGILNLIAIVVVLVGALTASLLLALPKFNGRLATERLYYFADRFTWLNRLLYASSVLLVAGVLEVASIAAWPIAPFQDLADKSAHDHNLVASGRTSSISQPNTGTADDPAKRRTVSVRCWPH